MDKYSDIINLPHHVSTKHPQMSIEARAAQFGAFAALTGYDDQVEEAARLTSDRIELDETAISILNEKLKILKEQISTNPTMEFTYFVPDIRKNGGKYITVDGIVKKIDEYKQIIVLEDSTQIPICEIIKIDNVDNNGGK